LAWLCRRRQGLVQLCPGCPTQGIGSRRDELGSRESLPQAHQPQAAGQTGLVALQSRPDLPSQQVAGHGATRQALGQHGPQPVLSAEVIHSFLALIQHTCG
jgi:hypothetical protein